jgi:hypothetical protein
MKIPAILFDYLESTEQDASRMTKKELLEEAQYVASPDGNWIRNIDERGNIVEDYGYTPQQVAALTRFINRLRKEDLFGE